MNKLILILSFVLIAGFCMAEETKVCYICHKDVSVKDILFTGYVDITNEPIHICYECASKFSKKTYGLTINAVNDDGSMIVFPGVIAHWVVPTEFINPQVTP